MAVIGHDETFLDSLRRRPPIVWLAVLVAAMPWIHAEWENWTIYPGHWLLSLLLLTVLARAPRRARRRLPLKPALVLGIYICLMAGLRGQWWLLGITAGGLLLNYGWGWAAWRLGTAVAGIGSLAEGQMLLLGASMAMGLSGWAAAYFWPPLCALLACPPAGAVPYPFLGGWANQGQYLIYLLFNLPTGATFVWFLYRAPDRSPGRIGFAGLMLVSAMGLMAGAHLWMLALAMLAAIGTAWRLAPLAMPGDARLARLVALAAALGALVVYGLFPAYLSVAARGATGGALLRVTYPQPPPVRLSSQAHTTIRLDLTNVGLVTLPGGSESPASLGARLLITPGQSRTRGIDVARLPLEQPLAPGRSVTVEISVRLPHWAKDGYLAWWLDSGRGEPTRLSEDSRFGFRFINRDFRNLGQQRRNFLTAMTQRARDFGSQTFSPKASERSAHTAGNLTGRLLDTLIFSPLWGLGHDGSNKRYPFSAGGPFWLLLFQEYGAIGLGLGLWFALSLLRRANRIALHSIRVSDRMLWRLVPLSGVVIMATGLFSREIGGFHGIWGLFLLSGFIEGRHDQSFARRLSPVPPPGRRRWFGFFRRRRRYAPPTGRLRRRWRN